jgi:hypothetical protein
MGINRDQIPTIVEIVLVVTVSTPSLRLNRDQIPTRAEIFLIVRVSRPTLGLNRNQFPTRTEIFLFFAVSRSDLGLNQLPFQCLSVFLFLQVKYEKREDGTCVYWPVKSTWNYISTPTYVLLVSFLIIHRDICILLRTYIYLISHIVHVFLVCYYCHQELLLCIAVTYNLTCLQTKAKVKLSVY